MTHLKLTNYISYATGILLLAINTANAAVPGMTENRPGTLGSQPLHTSATAEPNIVFLLDNSASMVNNSITTGSVTKTRLAWLKESLHTLIPELNGVRVGMFTFDSGNGSRMLSTRTSSEYLMRLLDKSDTTNYPTILEYFTKNSSGTIDALSSGSGGTILAESLQDIGRFYANDASGQCGGSSDADLTIYPKSDLIADGGLQEAVDCNALLGDKANIINKPEPIIYSCQKSFAIVMSDGETRADTGLRSDGLTYTNTTDAAGDFEDASGNDWTDASTLPEHPFRDYDQDCTSDAQWESGETTGYRCDTLDPTYDQKLTKTTDNGSNWTTKYSYNGTGGTDFLDDVAQALYEIDLRPDYSAFHNNVTTYTIGFADDSLDPGSSSYNPLMESAATQAGGEYYYATDAASLVNSFNSAITSILAQISSSAALSFNSSSLSSQSAVYKARFNTTKWSGELNSYPLDPFTAAIDKDCTLNTNNCWNAKVQLDAQTAGTANASGTRFILTYNGTYGTDFTSPSDYTNLNSSTDIPQALVDDLCAGPGIDHACNASTAADSPTGSLAENQSYIDDLVAFLRGDNSKETAATRDFRDRESDLGDIGNSTPAYVGNPNLNWKSDGFYPPWNAVAADDKSYSTWKKKLVADGGPKGRIPVVYVAANDGMLHGFRASESEILGVGQDDAGKELIAYYPTGTFSSSTNKGLHYLANKDYSHIYYNDLTPTITDAFMESKVDGGADSGDGVVSIPTKNSATAKWRTVLMGGLRGGGKGYYLLDITDPSNYVAGKEDELVLWEFNDSDDADLGYAYSKPIIAMLNNGQFAAIFGNGYNSSTCEAKLFVIPLDSGVDGTWTYTAGNTGEYFKYTTVTSPGGTCNGLSSPAVYDIDGNGTADRVYAGDLQGNMWAFDLCALSGDVCSSSPAAWGSAGGTSPLMIANDGTKRQPITVKPLVSKDPNGDNFDDLIIVFGTGQYETISDISNTDTQSVYGIRDYGTLSNTFSNSNRDPRNTSPDRWRRLTLSVDLATGNRKITNPTAIADSDYGWMVDLPTSGERLVSDPNARNDILYFNSIIPESTKCSYGGQTWLNSINVADGGAPPKAAYDRNGDGVLDGLDALDDGTFGVGELVDGLGSECTMIGNNCGVGMSNDNDIIREIPEGEDTVAGRMSWRELFGNE